MNDPIRFTDIPENEGKRNKTCISKVIREGRNEQKVHVKFSFPIENRNRYCWKRLDSINIITVTIFP